MIEQMTWECVLVSSRRLPPLHRRYKARSKVVVNGGKISLVFVAVLSFLTFFVDAFPALFVRSLIGR
jgi:hypothetical protein